MLRKYILVIISAIFIIACSSNENSHREVQKPIPSQKFSAQNYKKCTTSIKQNILWLKGLQGDFTYDRFRKCQNNYYLLELNSIRSVKNEELRKATSLLRSRIYQTNTIPKASIKVRFSLPNGKYSSFSGSNLRQSSSGGKDISAKGSGGVIKDEKDIWEYTEQLIEKLKLLLAGSQLKGTQRDFSLKGKVTVQRIESIITKYYIKLGKNKSNRDNQSVIGKPNCSHTSSTYIQCNITLLGFVIRDGGSILELKVRTNATDDINDAKVWMEAEGFYEKGYLKSKKGLLDELRKKKRFIESNKEAKKGLQKHINRLYEFLIKELNKDVT